MSGPNRETHLNFVDYLETALQNLNLKKNTFGRLQLRFCFRFKNLLLIILNFFSVWAESRKTTGSFEVPHHLLGN